ncbi:formylglycine-generating enzyme family protein [Corynebacterium qintianiae]|uniref:formylglycine-generating enzyme family protein n=1 Tax=Corynebacterium qintianiae TaxID=2709392 RepID=UPI0013ED1A94|nr:formylglycine-generating enzyme family protein [Corynebacterium qintianiae]
MPRLTEPIRVPGGVFNAGTNDFYPEEGPSREVGVDKFALESDPVTNSQFATFVEETGYVTVAEQTPLVDDFPNVDPALLKAGSLVFIPTAGPVDLRDWRQWWRFEPGASWRVPYGPGGVSWSNIPDRPVVQVAYDDALAYARWAGRRLPTELELEYAARAGRPGTVYAWGDEYAPGGVVRANTWQGRFPYENQGWGVASPVGVFGRNPWGFADLIGNVWEWTSTYYATGPDRSVVEAAVSCCAPSSAREEARRLATVTAETHPRRVVKGGSHLCAPEYCHRYRPPARQGQSEDSATTHIGFRCAA